MGRRAFLSLVNLDMRSLWLNSEISLFVYDSGFAGRLRSLQDKYLEDSDRLELDVWRQRPRWRQLTENTFRLLGPLL
jgi:cardiolipin synthase